MKNVTMYTENLKIVGMAVLYMAVILVCSALLNVILTEIKKFNSGGYHRSFFVL